MGLEWRGLDWFFTLTQRSGREGIGAEGKGAERMGLAWVFFHRSANDEW